MERFYLKAVTAAAFSLMIFLCGCASFKEIEPESVGPVALTEIAVNGTMKFFNYAKRDSESKAKATEAGEWIGGKGLFGKIATGLVKSAYGSVNKMTSPSLYTETLLKELNVEQIIMEELSNTSFVQMIPPESVCSLKEYSRIKSDNTEKMVSAGPCFRNFGYDRLARKRKTDDARYIVEKKLGAKGFMEVYVWFGYEVREKKDKNDFEQALDDIGNFLNKITFTKDDKSKLDTGEMHPVVRVTIHIYDKKGNPLSYPYRIVNGMFFDKLPKRSSADEYCFIGSTMGSRFVPIGAGHYDSAAFQKCFTEDLVRLAVRMALPSSDDDTEYDVEDDAEDE